MNWNLIHLIKGDKINVAYHYPSANIIAVSEVAFRVLESLKAGVPFSEVMDIYGEHKTSIISFIRSLEKIVDKEDENNNSFEEKKRVLDRITLHVSNDCNLRCKYCFAGGGNYNQARGMMTLQTAHAFVDFCIKHFDKIGEVVFFGGEPMLNVEVMEYICHQLGIYYHTGKSSFVPQFSIITNGTLLTPAILRFIKKNISFITVSIDGPEKINDTNRVYKNGRGSYKKIARFIHTIVKETDVKIQYEATFTNSHIDAHYAHKDIAETLNKEFGIDGLVVNEKEVDAGYTLEYLKTINCEDLTANDFKDLPEDFWHILHAVAHNETRQLCPVVKDIVAIGTDGSIYPCQMLNGSLQNRLGNINGENIFNAPSLYTSVSSKLRGKKNDSCKGCWTQKLCGGCMVKRFYNEKTEEFISTPDPSFCLLTRRYIEQILLLIAAIRQKPYLWSALIEKEKSR